ncbi:MAG: T9SS type A sorting domain-containing protein [Candidatus Brocadiaceae bacterium]|nr:T9SS type A sorting domain-containing protein [Candidatus Brocadiaceae bacterium]
MGVWKFKLLLIFVLLLSMAGPVRGQSVLLAKFKGGNGGSTTGSSYLNVASVSFELGFEGGVSETVCALPRVGCEVIPLEQILPGAFFDFDVSNTMFFTDVVALLTDGTDELLWSVIRLFNSNDVLLFGVGGGGFESFRLSGSPDLTGAQIDFIRVKVNDFTLSERSCCGGGGLEYNADIDWEIYGSGRPLVNIDIKPRSCPNPLNKKSKGVLPVAILGAEDFDVNEIDAPTIELEGIAALRSCIKDVSTPVVDGEECECNKDGPDGFDDLLLRFDTQAIVNGLGDFEDGDEIALVLTGKLLDGTELVGKDCIILKSKGCNARNTITEAQEGLHTPLQNYPGPFNQGSTIMFEVPEAGEVTIDIYNLRGQLIQTLYSGPISAGQHAVVWNGTDFHGSRVVSGIYAYKLQANGFAVMQMLIFTK